MEVINGVWYMNGLDPDDPGCIHSSDELIKVIKEIGFLPLFECGIPGFSVENMTDPASWWTGDPGSDPWEWRGIIAKRGDIAYGKFFKNRAGFISREWFPVFANYRREGYDFDARYEDGKAGRKEKLIMDLFLPEGAELWDVDIKDLDRYVRSSELFSNEVKDRAGFGKGKETGFESCCTKLQMQSYLIVRDFRQRLNKSGKPYGWAIAVYTLPEYVWGYDYISGGYKERPADSYDRMISHLGRFYDFSGKERLI